MCDYFFFFHFFRYFFFFFFSSRRRHTRCSRDWSSDVCSSDLCQFSGTDCWHVDYEAWSIQGKPLATDHWQLTTEVLMRHKVAGYKLGRNTSHRRSLFRNLVTSLIMEERIETTAIKAKAVRPLVEKMITLGKKGDLAARRQAAAYLMTDEAVSKLFD